MQKIELIHQISHQTGLRKSLVFKIFNAMLNQIEEVLSQKQIIHFRNFGSFRPKHIAQRVGRAIRAQHSVILPAHYKPVFKFSKIFCRTIQNTLTI